MSLHGQEIHEKPSESHYAVVNVPVKYISEIWPYIHPFLRESLEINPLMKMDDIIEGLADESLQLWVVVEDLDHIDRLVAVFLTAIESDRGEWVLSLHNLTGSDAKRWVMACHKKMHKFASFHDCTRVRMCGRKAWQRILPGYEVTGEKGGHLIYERPVV